MKIIANVIAQIAHNKVVDCSTPMMGDLKAWIANKNYIFDSQISSNTFSIRPYNIDEMYAAYGNDCARLCMSSFESMSGIKKESIFPKTTSWIIIRKYYSSFYAAHAILRLFGRSCSQLDRPYVNPLFEMAKIYSMNNGVSRIEDGFYSISYDKGTGYIDFIKLSNSHEDTWNQFFKWIEDTITLLPSTTSLAEERQRAWDLLNDIKRLIAPISNPRGNWLSSFRNSVNYRHSHGTWYPYESCSPPKSKIDSITAEWTGLNQYCPIGTIPDGIDAFILATEMIVGLCRSLVEALVGRSGNNSSAFKGNVKKMLNIIDGS